MSRTFQFALSGAIISSLWFCMSAQADLVYDFQSHSADQSGHSLTGSIVTTDNAINDGILITSEVVSWNWSISGPNAASVSSTDSGATTFLQGDVLISASGITIGQPNIMSDDTYALEIGNNSSGRLSWSRSEFFGTFTEIYQGANAWSTFSPGMSGSDPWQVANLSTVPEPSGGLVATMGIAGLLLQRRRRAVI